MQRARPRAFAQSVADDLDLADQHANVVGDRLAAADYTGMAAAIPAQAIAERHMRVKRQGAAQVERGEPGVVIRLRDVGGELRGGRIARVSGNAAAVFGDKGRIGDRRRVTATGLEVATSLHSSLLRASRLAKGRGDFDVSDEPPARALP